MRQSYLKNAALLTGSDVVLRLAGMGLRIWLANELGGEGMGLYQLVLAVYSLFVTLATAGVSVAATRLMAEELSGPDTARGAARGMLRRLLAAGLVLGLFAAALQLATADLAARCWLGDVRAAGALRVSALGMPWMAVSAVLRGFFIARRHVAPNVFSQLTEQTVRIALVALALTRTEGLAVGVRCMLVLGATAVSEAVTNAIVHAYPDSLGKVVMKLKILKGGMLEIIIRDWGCGIENVEQARRPMYTTGGSERSGMGFTIMESFMDSLKVRSVAGRGTTVVMKKKIAPRIKR